MVIQFWTSHANGPLGLYTGLLEKKEIKIKNVFLSLVLGLLFASRAQISLPLPVS